jgi:hypothetical protein
LESQVRTSSINQPQKMCGFRFTRTTSHDTTLCKEKHKSPCHSSGKAAKVLDALLVQTKASFWPCSAHQVSDFDPN